MTFHKRLSAAVVTLVVTLTLGLQAPATAALPGRPWGIELGTYWKCLEVQGGSTANSAQVQLWTCSYSEGDHRFWYMEQVTPIYWHIWNYKSGKCMNVKGASMSNRAKVIQYPCGGINTHNDQWYLDLYDDGTPDLYQIRNRKSGKCLNVEGATTVNGADLIQYTCNGSWNSLFTWWTGTP